MTEAKGTAPSPGQGDRAVEEAFASAQGDSTRSAPTEPRYALACPPDVPLALWRAYGDRYPGGPRRTRENREEAERYLAHLRRSQAGAATSGGGAR